ncbi:MAG TPA: heat-inducible transcription repressor HrcA [Nitrospirae bacterium]|nr:heat-inducible transcription repressor HrcA [Nitrospirota bacterium]
MSNLNKRHKEILWAIIQGHIDLNIPIGSILLTQRFSIDLSPATIRNTMAKLEEAGYITQPHRSAGRLPTEKGYRFYVDSLLEKRSFTINSALSNELSCRLRIIARDNRKLIREAALTLSSFSHYLAIATPPGRENIAFQRIKFIKYDNRNILTVLISDGGIVKNKIIELDQIYSQKELDRAADNLNNQFSGLSIKKVKEKLAYQLHKERTFYDELINDLMILCGDIIVAQRESFSEGLTGTSNLPDFASMKQIKEVLKAIEDKEFMLKLLNHISRSPKTWVLVGMEDILPAMKDFSMVMSPYNDRNIISGAIGIIGPTRMNYKKLIPAVDHTAKELTQILSKI